MIKVGQICEWYNSNVTFTITHIEYTETISNGKKIKNIVGIDNNGRCHVFSPDLAKECWIIAEYPTWQEAVNSKEFKGEPLR